MNNKEQLDQELLTELKSILETNPEAIDFMALYNDYIHQVDDIIDENGSYREVLKMSSLASAVFTTPFWAKYGSQLLLTEQLINIQYKDSVEWESSSEDWMREDAKCLSHAGYNMMFAILLLLRGRDVAARLSSRWRERAHRIHREHKENITNENVAAMAAKSFNPLCRFCLNRIADTQSKTYQKCLDGSVICTDCVEKSSFNPLNHEASK